VYRTIKVPYHYVQETKRKWYDNPLAEAGIFLFVVLILAFLLYLFMNRQKDGRAGIK
jgi:hypothetical protein